MDAMGYFYDTFFDPSSPLANLITDDDDYGYILQLRIQVYLQSGHPYVLVVTTHWQTVTENFSISAIGPALVGLSSVVPSTSQPIVIREFLIY